MKENVNINQPSASVVTDESLSEQGKPWMRYWLVAAGCYNLLWGSLVIVFPNLFFEVFDMNPPGYPEIWQCVGMIIGVYGIGYLIAARRPLRHWPIVLVGLLGKILGPIGFVFAVWQGVFSPEFGLTILTNDFIWWPAFSGILYAAWRYHASPKQASLSTPHSLPAKLNEITDNNGKSLWLHSQDQPVLLLCLRHAGCVFCREALSDLALQLSTIKEQGMKAAVVMMSSRDALQALAEKYPLHDVIFFSDPQAELYRALSLNRGTFWQLFHPRIWWRGFQAAILKKHGFGPMEGDGFQMSGMFVLHKGQVIWAQRHHAADEKNNFNDVCRLTTASSDQRDLAPAVASSATHA